MYLSKGIHTLSDYYPMVGILPFSVRMLPSMRSLGYREVELLKHTILGGPGIKARGHEFHYSERVGQVDESMVPFKTIDARGVETGDRGIIVAIAFQAMFTSTFQVTTPFRGTSLRARRGRA